MPSDISNGDFAPREQEIASYEVTDTGSSAESLPPQPAPGPVTPYSWRDRAEAKRCLLPELARFIEPGDAGTIFLRSPWVYSVPLYDIDLANFEANRTTRAFHTEINAGNLVMALCHITKPYRIQMLAHLADESRFAAELIREALASVWVSLSLAYPSAPTALRLFRKFGFFWAHDDEVSQTRPEWLKGDITVYRGAWEQPAEGLSWTLDPEVAENFALRFDVGRSSVLTGQVKASKVLAYLDTESTVIANPKDVRLVSTLAIGQAGGGARHPLTQQRAFDF